MEKMAPFNHDTDPGAYMIQTSEGAAAILAHTGTYIGGIDRSSFFWIYTNTNVFE